MEQDKLPAGWWVAQWSDRLATGAIEQARVGVHDIVVYRGRSGRPYAADAVSPDRGFPLILSEVLDEGLRSRIDGQLWKPESESTEPRLRHYPVSEQAGLILVGISEHITGEAPDLVTGTPRWVPAVEGRTWEGDGSPLIALENLCDPTSLRYLLGVSVVDGPSIVSSGPGNLHLSYRVADSSSEHTVDVYVKSPGLMWVSEPGDGGALFAVTPLGTTRVAIRACIGAPVADADSGLDWSRCIERQLTLTGLIRHVPGLNLNDDERRALDTAREWVGAI